MKCVVSRDRMNSNRTGNVCVMILPLSFSEDFHKMLLQNHSFNCLILFFFFSEGYSIVDDASLPFASSAYLNYYSLCVIVSWDSCVQSDPIRFLRFLRFLCAVACTLLHAINCAGHAKRNLYGTVRQRQPNGPGARGRWLLARGTRPERFTGGIPPTVLNCTTSCDCC